MKINAWTWHNRGKDLIDLRADSLRGLAVYFHYDVKSHGTVIYRIEIRFYQSFALLYILNPSSDIDEYSETATLDGIYYKVKGHEIHSK